MTAPRGASAATTRALARIAKAAKRRASSPPSSVSEARTTSTGWCSPKARASAASGGHAGEVGAIPLGAGSIQTAAPQRAEALA